MTGALGLTQPNRSYNPLFIGLHDAVRGGFALAGLVLAASQAIAQVPNEWTLSAGGEYGRDGSRGSQAEVDFVDTTEAGASPTILSRLSFGILGLHTDTPDSSSSSNATTTVTSSGNMYVGYGVDSLRGTLGFNATSDQDYRHSQQWVGVVHTSRDGWSADLSASIRRTRFDNFAVTGSTDADLGSTLAQSGSASCTLRDVGYGGTMAYATGPLTVYGSGTGDTYDAQLCSYDITVPSRPNRIDSTVFQIIAAKLINNAQLRSGGQIGNQTQLLKSQFGSGASYAWARMTLAFDYQHATSEFGDAVQDGYALSALCPVAKRLSVKLTTGITETDSVSAPYVGLYFFVHL